jgi:transmembrane sensor
MISLARTNPTLGMTPDEAAIYWVLQHDRGDLTAAEQASFDAWLAASETHARAFRKANGVWDVFDQADADPHLTALRQAALATRPARRRWIPAVGAGIAASLAAAAVLLPGQLQLADGSAQAPGNEVAAASAPQPAAIRFSTAKGERRTVQLPDGTRVTLNTDTAVALAYTPNSRLVRLTRGQALFEVAKDASRPFTVEAAGRRVTALGTIFEVRLDPGRMKVVLVEGRVVVDRASAASEPLDPAPTAGAGGGTWRASARRGGGCRQRTDVARRLCIARGRAACDRGGGDEPLYGDIDPRAGRRNRSPADQWCVPYR